ncbi:MAG: hypothetical protein IT486_12250 [Gammaproteobacteria bacterium]|nr:hypothetical protein [Gammaproteobacteria bacterium]
MRIAILLIILIVAAGVTWGDRLRTTSWTDTLWIGVFPVDGDGRAATGRYIAGLGRERLAEIEAFFRREAGAFGVAIDRPVRVELYPPVTRPPPRLDPEAGSLGHVWWSLRMRYYTWRMAGDALADVRIFVIYHDPQQTRAVPHSLGLQKGLLGVVYAYAARDMDEANNIVIAHEVLHTLGATDKYDPATGQPRFPEGYAEPDAEPRHPQRLAEVMAGRTALSPTAAEMPANLAEVVVGPATAAEINWTE